jgi:hypothetical protein
MGRHNACPKCSVFGLGHFAVGGHTDRYEMKKSPTGSGRRPLSVYMAPPPAPQRWYFRQSFHAYYPQTPTCPEPCGYRFRHDRIDGHGPGIVPSGPQASGARRYFSSRRRFTISCSSAAALRWG